MGPADLKNHDPGDNRTDTSMPRPRYSIKFDRIRSVQYTTANRQTGKTLTREAFMTRENELAIKRLRDNTGEGMMACRDALVRCHWNEKDAAGYLRGLHNHGRLLGVPAHPPPLPPREPGRTTGVPPAPEPPARPLTLPPAAQNPHVIPIKRK